MSKMKEWKEFVKWFKPDADTSPASREDWRTVKAIDAIVKECVRTERDCFSSAACRDNELSCPAIWVCKAIRKAMET
jgi:hypothetical protein